MSKSAALIKARNKFVRTQPFYRYSNLLYLMGRYISQFGHTEVQGTMYKNGTYKIERLNEA